MAAGLNARPDSDWLRHPVYDAVRDIAESLAGLSEASRLDELNARAASAGIMTSSGRPLRFQPPDPGCTVGYEQRVFGSGVVPTRNDSCHDFFNALVWLAFPRTKAAINRLHVEALCGASLNGKGRGPLRDLLTVLDESGAIVSCPAPIADDIRAHRWRSLFWERRNRLASDFRIAVMGHAVLEKAVHPWPGITCKIVLVPESEHDLDAAASVWLDGLSSQSGPRLLSPLPVFGLPGWLPETADPGFYDDRRWFRSPTTGSRPRGQVL